MGSLTGEQTLHMQTAILLVGAVDAPDPVKELKDKITLHNIAEYFVHDGSVRALLALSSNAVAFRGNTQTSDQAIQPTVFIAFSNSLRHTAHDTEGQSSMANFMAAQRHCGFPGAAACNVHGHALAALEGLPLGTIFSLLGQGYKLVATGYKFGGMVAHLFAARVLLQLQQEVQMARQMGISLTMGLADNKVSSYAFGSPFFATSSMGRVLASLDLQQPPPQQPAGPQQKTPLGLHTVWRAGDGSPAFFAATSELFTVAAAARDAAADAAAADLALVGDGDDAPSPMSIARTPQVAAVQEWCRYVSDGVDAASRCRSGGPSRLLARPLEQALLTRLCMPGGLFSLSPSSLSQSGDAATSTSGAASEAPTQRLRQVRISESSDSGSGGGGAAAAASSSAAGKLVSRARGILSARVSRTRSVEAGMDSLPASSSGPPRSPSPSPLQRSPSRGRRSAALPVSDSLKVASRVSSMTSRSASITMGMSPLAALRQTSSVTAGKLNAKGNWRDALLRLLQVMSDGLGERYAPVGQFWIIGSLTSSNPDKDKQPPRPATSSGSGCASGCLQPAEGPRAVQTSAAWLSPGNGACLFARWEAEVEEMQRDLMEAFPWATFRPTMDVRGVEMDRRDLLRASPSLNLVAP